MNYEQRITSQFEDLNLFNGWTSRYEYMIDFEKTSPPYQTSTEAMKISLRAVKVGFGGELPQQR